VTLVRVLYVMLLLLDGNMGAVATRHDTAVSLPSAFVLQACTRNMFPFFSSIAAVFFKQVSSLHSLLLSSDACKGLLSNTYTSSVAEGATNLRCGGQFKSEL
jgi:hypothetical protein